MRNRIFLALVAFATLICISAPAVLAAEPSVKDQHAAAMQGVWSIEAFSLEGNAIDSEQFKSWRRIVKNNHVTWKNGDDTMIELDIAFDHSKKPMTLDSTIAKGESKGQVLLAIYELKGDTLRVCFGNPDKPRPTDFSSKSGSGQSLYTAKRVKP